MVASEAVMKQLPQPYPGKGNIFITDTWYTSPDLCQYLHQHNTGHVGTLRPQRKNIPKLAQGLKINDMRLQQRGCMFAVQWEDKGEIY